MELYDLPKVKTLRSKLLPAMDEMILVPIGDIQFGTEACDVDRLQRHIDFYAEQPNAYFIGLGDYCDFGSPSNRRRLRAEVESGDLYDTARDIIDEGAESDLEELTKILAPTKGRWLGMVAGHHYWIFNTGETTDTRLCRSLDAPFLGDCGMVRVSFEKPKTHQWSDASFTIWAAHGKGAGMTVGAPLNFLERMSRCFEADVYLIGHHHKKAGTKMQRIAARFGQARNRGKPWLEHKNIILACTGGFLRGYLQGNRRDGRAQGTYVEKALLSPTALGGVVIYARPRWGGGGRYARVDLDLSL